MSRYKVVEKNNHHAIHCYTWSYERGLDWIEEYGDSKMFDDKTLTKDSFEVIEDTNTVGKVKGGEVVCSTK